MQSPKNGLAQSARADNPLRMFTLFGNWRRRRLKKRAFPQEWMAYLDAYVPFVKRFSEDEKERFLNHLKVFVWEKAWFGAHGFEVTDEVKVVVAAGAARLSRNLSLHTWRNLGSIIIYSSNFSPSQEQHVETLGQATRLGSVILSWDSVKHGIVVSNDGSDVSLHEFAHVLDLNGDNIFDGVPDLRGEVAYGRWAYVMGKNYERLQRGIPRQTVLSDYGRTNEVEFFAVATEAFFEKPRVLKRERPELYELLKDFYKADPGRRHP